MSNYTKATNFAIKDGLVTTDPAKIIKGTEIDNEYNAISNAIASKADVNSPALTGTPTAPTATAGTNTTQIATCAFALANGVPSGCILLWSGSIASIPSGWVLCNGSSGTPDLRNRFVVGAGSTYSVGGTGGSADAVVVSHTHTEGAADINHTHYFSATTDGMSANNPHSHNIYGPNGGGGNPGGDLNTSAGFTQATTSTDINHTHNVYGNTGYMNSNNTHSHTINSSGVSGTNANLPPYYALAYIMKS